jgi:hypothetical protein
VEAISGVFAGTESHIQRLHPAVKTFSAIILSITAGLGSTATGLLFHWLIFILIFSASRIGIKRFLKTLLPVWPVILISFASHYWFGAKDAEYAAIVTFRLVLLVFYSALLTFTTSVQELTSVFYRVFRLIPFIDAKGLSVSLGAAMGFVPVFFSFFSGGKNMKKRDIFSVERFLLPVAERALEHSDDSVKKLLDNFDESVLLPKAGLASAAQIAFVALVSGAGFYV